MTTSFLPRSARRLGFCSLALASGLCAAALLLAVTTKAAPPAEAAPASLGFPGCGLTIQACIDSAAPGQTIVIQSNTYITSLVLNKAVSLTGVNRATVILEALSNQRVLTVTGAAVDSHVVISGLTFAGGHLTSVSCPNGCGGAIIVEGNAQPLIEHVIISNSQAAHFGGGLFADTGSNLLLRDVRVISNSSTANSGGGVYSGAPLQIAGGEFRDNAANGFGGGLLSASSLIVTGTLFANNTASGSQGGGLYAAGNVRLTNAELHDNLALQGGGLYTEAPIFLVNTSIHNNFADQGGGAFGIDQFSIQGGIFQSNGSNLAGGGLHSEGPLVLTDTLFISNTTDGSGAGLYATFPLTMTGGLFQGNDAESSGQVGGGIYALSATQLSQTQFIDNKAGTGGGGAYVLGASTVSGADFENNQCTQPGCIAGGMVAATLLQIDGTRFNGNHSGSLGGGLYVQGLAVITSGHFDHNHCDDPGCRGGGLFAGTGLTVVSTEFRDNAAEQGGGLWHVSGDALIANSLFAGNTVSDTGAAMYLFSPGRTRIVETTVASPTLGAGAAIAVITGTVLITDTIVASYTVGIAQLGNSVSQDYNLFFANGADTTGNIVTGTHDLTGDPLFVDPSGGDYHLSAGSPAINSGTDAGQIVDFEGDPRPTGAGFDIGYDEYLARLFLPVVRR